MTIDNHDDAGLVEDNAIDDLLEEDSLLYRERIRLVARLVLLINEEDFKDTYGAIDALRANCKKAGRVRKKIDRCDQGG